MTTRDVALLTALAALWGASFMFIKVAVEDIGVLGLVGTRVGLGALGLLVIARLAGLRGTDFAARGPGLPPLRWGWWAYLVVALLATALPFLLIAWGEQHIES